MIPSSNFNQNFGFKSSQINVKAFKKDLYGYYVLFNNIFNETIFNDSRIYSAYKYDSLTNQQS